MLKEKLGFNASIRLLLPVLLILLLFSSGCSRIQPEATASSFTLSGESRITRPCMSCWTAPPGRLTPQKVLWSAIPVLAGDRPSCCRA